MKKGEQLTYSNWEIVILASLVFISGFLGGFLFGIIGVGIGGALGALISFRIINLIRRNKMKNKPSWIRIVAYLLIGLIIAYFILRLFGAL